MRGGGGRWHRKGGRASDATPPHGARSAVRPAAAWRRQRWPPCTGREGGGRPACFKGGEHTPASRVDRGGQLHQRHAGGQLRGQQGTALPPRRQRGGGPRQQVLGVLSGAGGKQSGGSEGSWTSDGRLGSVGGLGWEMPQSMWNL